MKLPPRAPACTLSGFLSKSGGRFRCTAITRPVFRPDFRGIAELSLVSRNICEFRHRGFWCWIQIICGVDRVTSLCFSLQVGRAALSYVKGLCYLWNLLTGNCHWRLACEGLESNEDCAGRIYIIRTLLMAFGFLVDVCWLWLLYLMLSMIFGSRNPWVSF